MLRRISRKVARGPGDSVWLVEGNQLLIGEWISAGISFTIRRGEHPWAVSRRIKIFEVVLVLLECPVVLHLPDSGLDFSMAEALPAVPMLNMEELFAEFLRRAESEGGEAWLRSCLASPPVPGLPGMASGEVPGPVLEPELLDDAEIEVEDPEVTSPEAEVPARKRLRRSQRRASRDRSRMPCLPEEIGGQRRGPELQSSAQQYRGMASQSTAVMPGKRTTIPPAGPSGGVLGRVPGVPPAPLDSVHSGSGPGVAPAPLDNEHLVLKNLMAALASFVARAVPSNPATVWGGAGPPGGSCSLQPECHRGVGVPETALRAPLPCVLTPLGFHLTPAVREKIVKGEYVDILSLLPSSKESVVPAKKADDKEDERKRTSPRSFQNWLQAFCIYSAVLVEGHPSLSAGLFQHVDIILEAYRNFTGLSWFSYDELFRQKLAVYPNMQWGVKDVGLWLTVMLPTRQPGSGNRQNTAQTTPRKGVCFAYNDGQCKWANNCKYRHECSFCGNAHPMSKCFKKAAQAAQSQSSAGESAVKGADAGDSGKYASLVRVIPKQGDGMSA